MNLLQETDRHTHTYMYTPSIGEVCNLQCNRGDLGMLTWNLQFQHFIKFKIQIAKSSQFDMKIYFRQ